MKKSASIFTPALTKALKIRPAVIQCQIDGEHIYISNGFFLVKLLPGEYDEFVRPVTQRDPGSWTIDEKGQPTGRKPIDMARFLFDFDSRSDLSAMVKAPFIFSVELTGKLFTVTAFYNANNGFVSFFDTKYTAMVSFDRVTLGGASPTAPVIAYHNGSPSALLLPMRIDNPALTAAVQAYFTEKQPKTKTAAPDPRLSAALEEIARLREELAQTQKQSSAAPEQPANKAAAVLAALESLEGITATVKGAQTSSPVVWVGGNAEAHKAALEKMGAKWSGKRSAYYIQAA